MEKRVSYSKKLLVTLSVLSAPFVVCAAESCAVQSSKLLSEGKSEQLSAKFKGQLVRASQLEELSKKVGTLTAIEPATGPGFKQHKRLSVGTTSGKFEGSWVSAQSEILGSIQNQVYMSSSSRCELTALHVDFVQ